MPRDAIGAGLGSSTRSLDIGTRNNLLKQSAPVIPATPVTPVDPITQAANVQVDALNNAIPFFQPFLDAGMQGFNSFAQTSTPGGLDEMIQMIMSGDLFGNLVDERTQSVQGQLAAGGLTRSGTAVEESAAIPTDIALMIEQLLSGRQGALGDTAFGASSNIADLTTQIGEAIASGILGNEAQRNANRANKDTNRTNLVGSIIGGLGAAFSDPLLKKNIEEHGKIGPLTLVKWDWIDETKGTIVEQMKSFGFLSTEVKEHFPEFVGSFGGFDTIDYHGLIKRLQCHS